MIPLAAAWKMDHKETREQVGAQGEAVVIKQVRDDGI